MTANYRAQATAIGGREGSAASADGVLRVALSAPTELGGSGGGTNPEQLFAAGYAACFLATLREMAAKRVADDANVTATVSLNWNGKGKGAYLDIALDVDLPGLAEAEAAQLSLEAHEACPYSKAVRGNVAVRVSTH
jgi:Ohr subfamily peroxiredoxin